MVIAGVDNPFGMDKGVDLYPLSAYPEVELFRDAQEPRP